MPQSPLLTGARVLLFVNGVLYGRVASFHFTSGTPRRRVQCVDSVTPFELAMTTQTVTGSMTVYRLTHDGGAEGAGMVAPSEELPREKYFSIVLFDRSFNSVIFQAESCSVEDQSWNFDAKGLATGVINFSAITFSNEVRPVG